MVLLVKAKIKKNFHHWHASIDMTYLNDKYYTIQLS